MSFRFIDLFAGIGGFHAALHAMGGECVYAVEIDEHAARVYQKNWKMNPLGDINDSVSDTDVSIPEHDVLVAGFPCQPFSKSGAQRGMEETRGTLYWSILRVIKARRPSLVILENVRNLAGPRHAHEWEVIISTLRDEGYCVSSKPGVFSPHLLPRSNGGRPQIRERVFIVAVRDDLELIGSGVDELPVVTNLPVDGWDPQSWSLKSGLPLLKGKKVRAFALTESETRWIDAWDDFVKQMLDLRNGERLPGFPIWADAWVRPRDLVIPSGTPKWKENFLVKNSDFYEAHRKPLERWKKKWSIDSDLFPPSRRKLEWQAQDTPSLWDAVMHLRPSGIRAKRPTYLPALVAITQTSIIGPERRRISPREAARLQGLPDWFDFGDQADALTYKQLGNGVSVGAVWHVLQETIARYEKLLNESCPGLANALLESPHTPDDLLNAMRD